MIEPIGILPPPVIAFRPARQPHEGPIWHARRLYEANAIGTLGDALRRGGWDGPYDRPAFPERIVRAIETSAGVADFFPRSQSRNLLRLERATTVSKGMICVASARLCPACIRESGVSHWVGELVLGSACPVHQKRLIDLCPECGRAFGWQQPCLGRCACGADLRYCAQSAAAPEEILANAALAGHAEADMPVAIARVAGWPLAERLALIRYLIVHLLGLLSRRAGLKAQPFEVISEGMRRVGTLLCAWPNSIPLPGDSSASFLTRAELFGPAWKAAKDLKAPRARRFLLEGFETVYRGMFPMGGELRRGRTAVPVKPSADFLTLAQAAREAGLGRERFRAMIAGGKIRAEKIAIGRTWAYRIAKEAIPEIRKAAVLRQGCTFLDVAKLWNVSDETVRILLQGAGELGVAREDPDGFKAGIEGILRSRLTRGSRVPGDRLLGFAEAVKRCLRRHGISTLDLARAVRVGRIRPVREDRAGGLDAFKFRVCDLDRLAAKGA